MYKRCRCTHKLNKRSSTHEKNHLIMIILQSESFLYFIIFHRDTHHYHVTITFQSWVSRSNISLYSTDKTAVSQMILCACEISIQTRFWRHIGKKVVLAHKISSYERIKNKQVTLVESKCAKTILYVIQLSDRVYNVTFPAYALYSLRRISRECHIIYPV